MKNKRINLCWAHMSGKKQSFIQEAFDTNWIVPFGSNVNDDDVNYIVETIKNAIA